MVQVKTNLGISVSTMIQIFGFLEVHTLYYFNLNRSKLLKFSKIHTNNIFKSTCSQNNDHKTESRTINNIVKRIYISD